MLEENVLRLSSHQGISLQSINSFPVCFCLFLVLILSYFILLQEHMSDGLYLTGRTGRGEWLT